MSSESVTQLSDLTTGNLLSLAKKNALSWKAESGGNIVGVLGAEVPTEIILAAGMLPVRLFAKLEGETTASLPYYEKGDSEIVQRLTGLFLSEAPDWMDIIVIGNTPTFNTPVFMFLREIRRLKPELSLPPLHIHETFHTGTARDAAYNLQSCYRLEERLKSIGGDTSEASYTKAARLIATRRSELVELFDKRSQSEPEISGGEVQRAIAHTCLMPNLAVPSCTSHANKGPKLLFSGTDIGQMRAYDLIERAGCTIVSDDHDMGEPVCRLSVSNPATVETIAKAYSDTPPRSARWPTEDRITHVIEQAKSDRVDGVIFWINDEDHPSSWDLPELKAGLEAIGLPALIFPLQPLSDWNEAEITQTITDWIASEFAHTRVETTQ